MTSTPASLKNCALPGMMRMRIATTKASMAVLLLIGSVVHCIRAQDADNAAGGTLLSEIPLSLEVGVMGMESCMDEAIDGTCLTALTYPDSLKITWRGMPDAPDIIIADEVAAVDMYMCYSPTSSKDREWRKANDDITKSKQCKAWGGSVSPSAIGKNIPWNPSEDPQPTFSTNLLVTQPTGTYYVLILAMNANGKYIGQGASKGMDQSICSYGGVGCGYFQITGLNGVTPGIRAAAISLSTLSGCIVLGQILWNAHNRKN